ncbi:MAG: xanthine dehydrogenase family protein molybdopterin-binding subunit [Chloroflexota bacterium]
MVLRAAGDGMKRVEDPRFLAGQGAFVADLHRPGELHMAFYRSPYAHARIRGLRMEAARAAPGVVAVLAAQDVEGAQPMPSMHVPHPEFARTTELVVLEAPAPLLASGTTRYAGEPLALVVAESRAAAEDAVGLIELDAEPLTPVVDFDAALSGPALYEELPGNLAASLRVRRELPSPSAEGEELSIHARFRIARQGGAPIETRGVLADMDPVSRRVTLWTSTQVPHLVRLAVSHALGRPEEQLHVITPDVGGGFGTKANTYAEEALAVYCAAKLGRPVRWIEDRSEHFLAAAQSRDQVHEVELTVDSEGRILSFKDDYIVNLGAYSLWTAGIVCNTALHALGPYRVPVLDIRGRAILSNKPPAAQYRGAGRPEACFALERALDMAANRVGIDGLEIRRRNLIRPEEMPYAQRVLQRDGIPIVYDASDYLAILDKAVAMAEPAGWPELRRCAEAQSERLGIGCAAYVEATGRGPFEGARVSIGHDGSVQVATGAACSGQGHETTLAKICARVLEVPMESIRVRGGDTDLVTRGVGTFASRTAVVAGNAVYQASQEVREKLLGRAADVLKVPPTGLAWRGAAAHTADGRSLTLAALASAESTEAEAYFRPETVTWTMGLHLAVVAVQPGTGGLRILRYVSVHDGGVALDETIVDGQMHGGIAQGIGGGLFEEFSFTEDGQPTALTMADYMLPTSMEMPDVRVGHTKASANNPLGIKGVGESGAVPAAAALANAISNALDGAELNETPLSPERVWRAAGGVS